MPTQLSSLDWKSIFESIHAASAVVIPTLAALAYFFRKKISGFIHQEVGEALKSELPKRVGNAVGDILDAKTETFKRIARDANEELLVKINGTYVRTREQQIRDEVAKERLDRIEDKVDQLRTHFT
jgi:hypothetical protein